MNISKIKFLASRHFHRSVSSPPPLVNNRILCRPHGTAGLGPNRAPPSRLVRRRRPGPGQANLQSGSGGHDVLAVMYPTNAVIGWRGGNCIPPRRPCSPEIPTLDCRRSWGRCRPPLTGTAARLWRFALHSMRFWFTLGCWLTVW